MSKTVFITGSSSGIGEATAQYFLKQGWNVVATARSPQKVGAWSHVPQAIVLPLDVTDDVSVACAICDAHQRFGTIDVLINNAGVAIVGPLEATSISELERNFQTNFFGLVRVTQTMLPLFRLQGHGLIVNISSLVGRFGVPFLAPYGASKFAVEGLSESMRFELRPFGIRVKLIEPGSVKTNSVAASPLRHEAYESIFSKTMSKMNSGDSPQATPNSVAKTIFKASNDRSDRLRYSAKAGAFLAMNQLLPDRLWRTVIQKKLGLDTPR